VSENANFKLIIEDDEGRRSVVPIDLGEVSIGRVEENTIRLDERNVSRRHARLLKDNGAVFAEDLSSYNGVWVNGDRVAGRREIKEGDLIRIGDFHLELRGEGLLRRAEEATQRTTAPARETTQPEIRMPAGENTVTQVQALPHAGAAAASASPSLAPRETAPLAPVSRDAGRSASRSEQPRAEAARGEEAEDPHEATAIIRIEMLSGLAGKQASALAGDKPKLVCVSTNLAGREYEITKTEVVIGRTDDNDIVVDHRSVSRHHAKILVQAGRVTLVDMKSANGTLINGEEYAQTDLKRGDLVELGHVRFRFVPPGQTYAFNGEEASALKAAERGGLAAADAAREIDDDDEVTNAALRGTLATLKRIPVVPAAIGGVALLALILIIVVVSSGGEKAPPALPDMIAAGGQVLSAGTGSAETDALLNRANAELQQRRWDKAGDLGRAVLAMAPQSAAAQQLVTHAQDEGRAQGALEAASASVSQGDIAGAWRHLKQVPATSVYHAQAQALSTQVRGGLVSDLANKARAALEGEAYDAALGYVDELASVDASRPEIAILREEVDRARQATAARAHPAPSSRPAAAAPRAAPPRPPPVAPRAPPPAPREARPVGDPKVAMAEGYASFKAGDLNGAIDAFNRCIQIDPTFAKCYRALGITYAKSGNGAKASRYYRQYLKVDPNADDATQVRALLETYESGQ